MDRSRDKFTILRYEPRHTIQTSELQITPVSANCSVRAPNVRRSSDPPDEMLLKDAEIAIRESNLADTWASKKMAAQIARRERRQTRLEANYGWINQFHRGGIPSLALFYESGQNILRGEEAEALGAKLKAARVPGSKSLKDARPSCSNTSKALSRSPSALPALMSLDRGRSTVGQTRPSTSSSTHGK